MLTLESLKEDVLEEMEKLRVLYALKQTLRYQSVRDTAHSESVGEHLFGMEVLAQYFLPLEDPEGRLDRIRVHELILFHELGEIETGDILFHHKTDDDREEEQHAAERVASRLPASLQKIALERSREFDNCKTPEAKFAAAIDKIEPIFEMWDEQVMLHVFKRVAVDRETVVKVKRMATEEYPYMRKFVDAWEERAVSLDVFPGTIAVC